MKCNNHYEYLDKHLDLYWKKVFNKSLDEMYCSNIVSCHGDKGYGYRRDWNLNGISFERGMMLYMLTYFEKVMTYEEWKSKEWVIDNYKKYLPIILEVEKEMK